MKIESSSVALASQSTAVQTHSVSERLRTWVGERRPDFERLEANANRFASALLDLSAAGRAALQEPAPAPSDVTEVEADPEALDSDPRLQLISRMIELMTGYSPRRLKASDLNDKPNPATEKALRELKDPRTAGNNGNGQPQRVGWGLEYDRREVRYEAQTLRFAAQGEVRTADGQTIQFAVALEMRREYYEESQVSIRAGDAVLKDPLVVNFGGSAAELSGLRFDFDLDADGQTENIAFVGSGSGLLALDRNGNGQVDDGRELFGALSGDGFADLAALDGDGNGWIDENDAAYQQLRVWMRDAQGNNTLATLAQANVGALYLDNVASPFSLRDSSNQTLGELRATGIYLEETGGVGTLQQIDIAV